MARRRNIGARIFFAEFCNAIRLIRTIQMSGILTRSHLATQVASDGLEGSHMNSSNPLRETRPEYVFIVAKVVAGFAFFGCLVLL
jgi:hypothetical protein